MKKKILHLEISKYSKTDIEELKNNFDVIFFNTNSQAEFKNIMTQNNFFGIFTKLGLEINKEILSMQPHLKYIITPTTGLNHTDDFLTGQRCAHTDMPTHTKCEMTARFFSLKVDAIRF